VLGAAEHVAADGAGYYDLLVGSDAGAAYLVSRTY
jgi:hypothetical protein